MKKQIVILTTLLVFSLIFFSSFIGIANYGDSPGLIQAIGDAGSPNVFTFREWSFSKAEMLEGKVENIQVEIEINTGSLTTEWKDLEKNIKKKKDYFYVKKFPKATVVIDGAKALDDEKFKTTAQLTLKGITKPVDLIFSIEGNTVKGEGLIQRREFKFTGDGPKNEVPILFEAELPF
mgnify:CR=1 FL=1